MQIKLCYSESLRQVCKAKISSKTEMILAFGACVSAREEEGDRLLPSKLMNYLCWS
jgi:hypothetical protein